MAANDGAADFVRLLESTAQDSGDGLGRHNIVRHAHQVQGAKWTTAHREDVRERVRRSDLAISEGVINDRSEEVGCLHESAVAIETENARVIGGGGTDEDIAIR